MRAGSSARASHRLDGVREGDESALRQFRLTFGGMRAHHERRRANRRCEASVCVCEDVSLVRGDTVLSVDGDQEACTTHWPT